MEGGVEGDDGAKGDRVPRVVRDERVTMFAI